MFGYPTVGVETGGPANRVWWSLTGLPQASGLVIQLSPLSSENETSAQATVRSIVKMRDESVSPRRLST